MEHKKTSRKRLSKSDLICRICGGVARGYNFNVITCMSCKAFFRRDALQLSKIWQCQGKNDCDVTKQIRNGCAACRLRKCYACGMNPRLMHSIGEETTNSHAFDQLMITAKQQVQLSAPKPLNLLRNDCSTLTSEQWNLLSNIIRSYDEPNIINSVIDMLAEKSSLPPKLSLKSENSIDFIGQMYRDLIPLLKRSSHFRSISTDAYRTLLSYNVFFTGNLNKIFVVREINALQNTTYVSACTALFGSELVTQYIRDNEQLLPNGNLYKLMLFVLIFSSNCSLVVYNGDEDLKTMASSIELIQMQDIYVTMLWKYLVYIYGYHGAVMHFTILIKNVLDVFVKLELTLKNVAYDRVSDIISTVMKRSLVINDSI